VRQAVARARDTTLYKEASSRSARDERLSQRAKLAEARRLREVAEAGADGRPRRPSQDLDAHQGMMVVSTRETRPLELGASAWACGTDRSMCRGQG